MEFVISLLPEVYPNLHLPGAVGLAAWGGIFILLLLILLRLRGLQAGPDARSTILLMILAALAAAFSLFLGVRVPLSEPVPFEGLVGLRTHVFWMLFSALPMFLAACISGPAASFLIALLTGALAAFLQTHNPFTILEYGLYGMLAGTMIRQPYRTRIFRLISQPLVSAVLLSLLYPLVYFIGAALWLEEPFSADIGTISLLFLPRWLSLSGSLLIAGLLAGAVIRLFPDAQAASLPLRPSPAERSLSTRTTTLVGLLTILLAGVLSVVGWFVAYRSALDLTQDRMAGAAALAADNVPSLLEIGQNMILTAARSPDLVSANREALSSELERMLLEYGYFDQFLLIRSDREIYAGSADANGFPQELTQVESSGVDLAEAGVPFQYYTSTHTAPDSRAFVSFIAALPEGEGVLIGRMVFSGNKFTAPLVTALENLNDEGGTGILVDDAGWLLYHPVQEMVGTAFQRNIPEGAGLTGEIASDGTRVFVYSASAPERPWTIVMEIPVARVQQLAIQIAAPLVGMLVAFAVTVIVLLQIVLRVVTGSLRSLAFEANRIAEDPRNLETPLRVGGADEVAVMRQAFERMRVSLSSRMEEQKQLLLASNGAAASLNFDHAVRPVLVAALSTGAASARVVLNEGVFPEKQAEGLVTYGAGSSAGRFTYLDAQILALSEENDPLIIRHPVGSARLTFPPERQIPGTIIAVALRQEQYAYGVLWIAYDVRHAVSGDQVRFLSTLGAQTVLAAANARLFMDADIGRERLSAMLTSTPDPIIVIDEEGLLLLANPAAWNILGSALEEGQGLPIETLLKNKNLTEVLLGTDGADQVTELTLSDEQVYSVKATAVISGGRSVGRICILRDVTRFKEVDALKSEVMHSVTHDLKKPLVVIRSYSQMLSMIGDLNAEQASQVQKIIKSVDRMSKILDDMLLLGRLESEIPLVPEAFFPQQALKQVAETFRPVAAQRQVILEALRSSDDDRLIQADRMLIERALENLIDNAIKYTPAGGRVELSAAFDSSGRQVIFTVRDTGHGISPAHQERLFERFYRVPDRETLKQPGTGLGLSIVRSAAERHGGKVLVESAKGRGSLFQIIIPVSFAQNPARKR